MIIDWNASKEAWINEVRGSSVPHLIGDPRFPDAARMASRFEAAVAKWKNSGGLRPVINEANELGAAAAILRDLRTADQLLYEPKLANTGKTIDFSVVWADGGRSWVDMKTVAPSWQDDDAGWKRIMKVAGAVPENTRLVLDQGLAGAASAGSGSKPDGASSSEPWSLRTRSDVWPSANDAPSDCSPVPRAPGTKMTRRTSPTSIVRVVSERMIGPGGLSPGTWRTVTSSSTARLRASAICSAGMIRPLRRGSPST